MKAPSSSPGATIAVSQSVVVGVASTVVLSVVVLKLVLPFAQKYSKNRKLAKQVGQTKGHWLWGDMSKYNFSTYEGLQNAAQRCEEHPAMCSQWIGPFHFNITLYHPDVTKTLLSKSLPKGNLYKFLKPILKEGLVTSRGDVWKRHRRLLTPIFHFELLKSHIMVFNKNCQIMLDRCESAAESGTKMDVGVEIFDMSFNNMMECVMSQTAVDSKGTNAPIIQSIKDSSFFIFRRIANPLMWSDFVYNHTKDGRDFQKCIKRIHDECKKIITERRAVLTSVHVDGSNAQSTVIEDESTGKSFSFRKRKGKFVDFLDILVQTKDQDGVGLTDDEIIDEVITFFSAGQETVANGLSWTFYNLSNNPGYQQKCRDEIEEVIGFKDEVDMNDMNKLVYVTRCIKESLRLMPIIHIISRELTEDVTFSHRFNDHKEVTVPAGNFASVNIYALHRNPHVWQNPNVFNPENFNAETAAKRSPFAFVPFAAGPRNCIGQHFAMHQMRVVLCQLLRRYEFYRDPDTQEPQLVPGVTLQSRNGIQLKVKHIQ